MIIHTVAHGESIISVAKKYSISVTKLMGDNGLYDERLAVGEELVILKPTREAPVRGGDTLSKIALRFGVKKSSLLRLNTSISGDGFLRPGQMLAIKASAPPLGTASALGIVKVSTSIKKFKSTLPFLTYVAAIEYSLSAGRLKKTASLDLIKKYAKNRSCTLLTGIGGCFDEAMLDEGNAARITKEIIEAAEQSDADGIYLKLDVKGDNKDRFLKYLLSLRRALLGKNLILICETSYKSGCEGIVDLSDACTLRLTADEEDVRRSEDSLIAYSSCCESSKSFLMPDVSAQLGNGETLCIADAVRIARRSGKEINARSDEGRCRFSYNRYRGDRSEKLEISYPSMQGLVDELRLAKELGFCGFAFDIETTPISYFCIFNALFSRADYFSVADESY